MALTSRPCNQSWLEKRGDVWVCPQEGYIEVARLERHKKGYPIVVYIKNQFLKDYLCARNCGLSKYNFEFC